MAIKQLTDVPLASISTFRIGGLARAMAILDSEDDLVELFRTMPSDRPWFVLGGGSNIVFPDGDCDTLIIQLAPAGIQVVQEDDEQAYLTVGAGVPWDDVVSFAVDHKLSGIEALSFIPGTAGATPIQNVGAYGVEIKDVLHSVRAFNIQTKKFVTFSNEECKFGYRDSMFKHEGRVNGKTRYIITQITLVLSKGRPNVPQYPGVADYLLEKGITRATLADIRNAIIAIRTKKLSDPKDVASVGSFFKNPFVSKAVAEKLKQEYPTLAVFPINESVSKVGAGSLIDTLGWKGKRFGHLSIYAGNALVLVNEGGATRKELSEVTALITEAIQKKYGITLEPEPELLDF